MQIKELLKNQENYLEKEVKLYGWMRNHRIGKNVCFINLNDGTCFDTIQIVYLDLENQIEINKAYLGSGLEISGIVKSTNNPEQPIEISATKIEILAPSLENYPLQPKRHTYEFLREISHLRIRTNTFNAVFKIRSLLSFAVHDYFNKENFVMVHTPILTASDAEGAGEMFQVTTLDLENKLGKTTDGYIDYKKDFFNKKTSLTVSGQLLAEAYALAFKNVYTFGPTFRAENSNTTRHAAEFWMIEPEIAFAELDDIIKLAKELLIYVVNYVLKEAPKELLFLDKARGNEIELVKRLEALVNTEFEEITYYKAIEILKDAIANGHKFENPVFDGVDLATEHEKYLTDVVFKAPVFVTNYPKEIKAFYMRQNDDGKTVAATDLLVPGIGELLGGSAREERMDKLKEMMEHHNLEEKDYWWYLQLRQYGGVKHGGFGIGFERLVMYVTGMENIRDVIPFARTTKNCEF